MKILIKNGTLIIDGKKRIDNGAVLVEDTKIIGIYKNYKGVKADKVIDAKENYIIPGLIETHTHGIMGYDFNTCKLEDLQVISDACIDEGVTCFMASLVCESHERMLALMDMYEASDIANMLGVHIEGPFLNTNNKGVMKVECLQQPSINKFDDYLKHCSKIKSMTIAPELEGALDLITYGNNQGIVINVGHSSATASQVIEAQQYGAKGITHLYNAMGQHLHRDPGVVTGAFISDLMCEMIVDGFHIHEDVVRATYKAIGKERLILICDANPCKGLPDGTYLFSGKEVEIIDGKARVKETGRIAGSTVKLNEACYNMMKYCGCSIDDAVLMASYNPAKQYGLNKGKLAVGYDGDVVVVNDKFNVLAVVNQGEIKKDLLCF
ncbi:MAG: N-acetylglucosamine-6-phosphate deacetylase [Bacilli bacterium]|nr:N-acetylglucosamine-6-phosphate deacetylase [Bacilli bacterium]